MDYINADFRATKKMSLKKFCFGSLNCQIRQNSDSAVCFLV